MYGLLSWYSQKKYQLSPSAVGNELSFSSTQWASSSTFKHFWTINMDEILYSLPVYEINESKNARISRGRGAGEPPPSFSLDLKLMATSEVTPQTPQFPGTGKLLTRPCHQSPPWLVTTSQKQELKPPCVLCCHLAARLAPSGSSLRKDTERGGKAQQTIWPNNPRGDE